MATDKTQPGHRPSVPGRLLYLTEPARAVVDIGLLASTAPLLRALPRGDGHPVLVLPGLGSGDATTVPLRVILRRLGYWAYGWGQGTNLGPTEATLIGMRARLDTLAERHGTAVSLIGWSLGGIFARRLAARTPDTVRQVITLGTPLDFAPGTHSRTSDLSEFPQWPHWSDWARWYGELQADARDLPPEAGGGPLAVPTTALYSTLDGIVGPRACRTAPAPHTENIVVTASHLGFAFHPAVVFAIADRLALPAGQWSPFRPPAVLRAAYRLG